VKAWRRRTLADTIMFSPPKQNVRIRREPLVSIPHDLYVKVPNQDEHRKINAVFALDDRAGR
jgi:anionic cell wall polymer biosynthesis LytR-Cps2A-Psr (LCP) family protein